MHHVSVKKLSNLFIPYSARLLKKKEDEQYAWVVITLTSNVIPVKLKVAVNADAPVQHIQTV